MAYNMSLVPRRNKAEIFIVNVNFFSVLDKIQKYSNNDKELALLVLAEVMITNHFIRYGDIVIEKDLYNNYKMKNPGYFIYDGSKLQYLDRHIRNIGIIPKNFLSFQNFKLGFWESALENNLIWIDTNGLKYTETKNGIETPFFCIYCNKSQISYLIQLLKSNSLILLNYDKNNNINMFFDYKLNLDYNIYYESKKESKKESLINNDFKFCGDSNKYITYN